ncbi:LysE family transporter [Streptomyces sp. NPDC093260]|uniref:LysE family transporter n=1 Tax=Streptomyces sp. NPDC093260 TaxID=3155073 RepID=UPI00342A66C5
MPQASIGRREVRPHRRSAGSGRQASPPHRKPVAAAGARPAGSGHVHDRPPAAAPVRRPSGRPATAAPPPGGPVRRAHDGGRAGRGLLAGYGVAVPVGAVGAHPVSLTARTSLRTGVFAAPGVVAADGPYALPAVLGGPALAGALRPVLGPLRWVSVLVLAAPAVQGAGCALRRHRAHRPAVRAGPPAPGAGRACLGLLGITLLDPATVPWFSAAPGPVARRPRWSGRVRAGGVRRVGEPAGAAGRGRRAAGAGPDRLPGTAGDGPGVQRCDHAVVVRMALSPG